MIKTLVNKCLQLVTITLIAACSISPKEVAKYNWKHAEGYHIGDWLTFDGQHYQLKEDSIYQEGKLVATIKKANKHEMTISAIDTNYNGTYTLK